MLDPPHASAVQIRALDAEHRSAMERTCGMIFRPIGVRRVSTCRHANTTNGKATRAAREPGRNGIDPQSRPHSTVGCVWTTSYAMSVPECEAPTTRTGPSFNCSGRRYSLEWS
jgi:hypothetical protein